MKIGLSRMIRKNSGGEGQNPLYVALLASFAQAYRINLTPRPVSYTHLDVYKRQTLCSERFYQMRTAVGRAFDGDFSDLAANCYAAIE